VLESLAQSAASADAAAFWFASLVAALAAGLAMRRGLQAFWKLRLIVDTPTARIRSAPQGYVELQGQAHPLHELLSARLSGAPCVWYRYQIQERRRGGRHSTWVTIEQGDAGRAFILDDGSGRCLVDPDGAALRCRIAETWFSAHAGGSRAAPAGGIGALVEQRRRYRMTEERIADQEFVYVLGHFETPRRGERERQRLTRQLLSQWKRDARRMHAFDRNGDGQIDLAEWENARSEAERLAERAEARLSAEPPLSRVGRSDDPRQPFVVSTEDARTLAARQRLHAVSGTVLGLLLGVGVAFALWARLSA
jgi:hypothetical protein